MIDLSYYSKKEIEEAISTFGYTISSWNGVEYFTIYQGEFTYSFEDSVMLTCECLFELEL